MDMRVDDHPVPLLRSTPAPSGAPQPARQAGGAPRHCTSCIVHRASCIVHRPPRAGGRGAARPAPYSIGGGAPTRRREPVSRTVGETVSPEVKERLQTALLYIFFVLVYVVIAALLGTLVGIVTGSTEDDVLRGAVVGAIIGAAIGGIAAIIGRDGGAAPAAAEPKAGAAGVTPPTEPSTERPPGDSAPEAGG